MALPAGRVRIDARNGRGGPGGCFAFERVFFRFIDRNFYARIAVSARGKRKWSSKSTSASNSVRVKEQRMDVKETVDRW
jgi:hypothetical protein